MYTEVSKKEATRKIQSIEEFSDLIKRERFRSDRNNQKFSLITFDIEAMKNTVQTRLLFETLESRLRLSDEVGWLDKRRIAVLLPETPIEGARKLAHSLNASINGYGSTPHVRFICILLSSGSTAKVTPNLHVLRKLCRKNLQLATEYLYGNVRWILWDRFSDYWYCRRF